MSSGSRENIVLCVTGGIAAYKALSLIRLFKKSGYEVKTVATQNALRFVTPLSLETLSQNPLYSDTFDRSQPYQVDHVALAQWADAVVVAPATANILGKYANGIADDALSTFLLAVDKPVFMAPAMNTTMYRHPAVQENMRKLEGRGVHFVYPADGQLACASEGTGRMEEPEAIFKAVRGFMGKTGRYSGVHAIVTAGPTYEQIDPVRFIGNHSSGKMGFALAEALAAGGASVDLVTGPTHLVTYNNGINRIDVTSADQMADEVMRRFPDCHISIMAAAVADFKPEVTETHKIKKHADTMTLELVKTTDILACAGKIKTAAQTLVGFALETDNEIENAAVKLKNKNADFIVLNSLKDKNACFGYDTNKVSILDGTGVIFSSDLKSKEVLADDILSVVMKNINICK